MIQRGQSQQWAFLPFGKWNPGLSSFQASELRLAEGVLPVGNGYRGFRDFEAEYDEDVDTTAPFLGDITASEITGIHVHLPGTYAVTTSSKSRYVDRLLPYLGVEEWTLVGATLSVECFLKDFDGNDISRAAGYQASTIYPTPWKFISWGSSVLATNYADPVQRLTHSTTGPAATFTDCIASTAKPYAKYIATLGQHVVLANIRLDSSFEGLPSGPNPQTVWWSATNDETTFGNENSHPGDNTSYETLVDTPGEITGLAPVGDDALLIFKTSSIHLMAKDGGFGLFSFRTLHRGYRFGTAFPESIVVDGTDVYYFNTDGVPMVCKNLGTPEPVVSEELYSWLLDRADNEEALGFVETEDSPRPKIVGSIDAGSRNIIWFYTKFGNTAAGSYSTDAVGSVGFWLSTTTGRSSVISLFEEVEGGALSPGLKVGAACPYPGNTVYESLASNDAIPFGVLIGGTYVTSVSLNLHIHMVAGRLIGTNQVQWTIGTKSCGLYPEVGGLGSQPARVFAVRPIFRKGGVTNPSITIRASDEPFMLDPTEVVMDPSSGFIVNDNGSYAPSSGYVEGTFFEFDVTMPAIAPVMDDTDFEPSAENLETNEIAGLQILIGSAGVK